MTDKQFLRRERISKEELLKKKYAINFHEKTGYKQQHWIMPEFVKIYKQEIVPDPPKWDGIETIGTERRKNFKLNQK